MSAIKTRIKKSLIFWGFASVVVLAGCEGPPSGDPYYQRSSAPLFDFDHDADYQAYLDHERLRLAGQRVFFDPEDRELELDRVAPFELKPEDRCPVKRGVLLIHGLLDTAFALRDIGSHLQQQCTLVRAIVLPGHGTRPADLIGIERQDWRRAVAFGIASLKRDTDEVFVIGHSLGGALAVDAALGDQEIDGLVLLAPAIEVAFPILAWQSLWYRYLNAWVDIDPNSIPVRYQSMPTDAVAETYLLGGEVRDRLKAGLETPVLMLLSQSDLVISSDAALEQFQSAMSDEANKAIVYGSGDDQPNLRYLDIFSETDKILNGSHVSLSFSPDNPVFGKHGSHKECGLNVGLIDRDEAERCVANPVNWKGELGSAPDESYLPIQRLTYNPLFDRMLEAIDRFMTDVSATGPRL